VVAIRASSAWERYAWAAGIVFVVALVAEVAISVGIPMNQDDSVGDVFGSLFVIATGLLVMRSGVLPRWLAGVSIAVGVLFFLQGFGLGGVIHLFGLVLDLIGFVLFLIFVLVSSVILLRRETAVPATAG
jgi:hypothetical protein